MASPCLLYTSHAWPGNVRELRQKVMGAVLQAQEGVVMKEHLELAVTKPTSTAVSYTHLDVYKRQVEEGGRAEAVEVRTCRP